MLHGERTISIPMCCGLPAFDVTIHYVELNPMIVLEPAPGGKPSLLELTRAPFSDEISPAKESKGDAEKNGEISEYHKFIEVLSVLVESKPRPPQDIPTPGATPANPHGGFEVCCGILLHLRSCGCRWFLGPPLY